MVHVLLRLPIRYNSKSNSVLVRVIVSRLASFRSRVTCRPPEDASHNNGRNGHFLNVNHDRVQTRKMLLLNESFRESLRIYFTNVYGDDVTPPTLQFSNLVHKISELLSSLNVLLRFCDDRVFPKFLTINHHISTFSSCECLDCTNLSLVRRHIQTKSSDMDFSTREVLKRHFHSANTLFPFHYFFLNRHLISELLAS